MLNIFMNIFLVITEGILAYFIAYIIMHNMIKKHPDKDFKIHTYIITAVIFIILMATSSTLITLIV